MSYELTERIMAVAPEAVEALFPQLLAQYGEELPDGPAMIRTIGGFWCDKDRTILGAASLGKGSIAPITLTDGRLAFRCLWQADLAAAFDAGQITGAEQLTEQQLADLTPQYEVTP